MIDLWLVFSMMIPFSMVILHTLLNNLQNEDESHSFFVNGTQRNNIVVHELGKAHQHLKSFIRFGLPFFYIIFSLAYFAVGFYLKYFSHLQLT